ncbi:MAG: nitrous oxide reductase family maturation protein NosD [Ignavibacteriae bacterium]|nr:nitrous oxide reductase family maturation protein NosD [Ignavibacteriota bacterium]
MKTFIKIYFLFLFIITFRQAKLEAKEIIIDKSGKITSIKQALRMCQDGDRLLIKKGYYKEYDIEINKRVQITGEGMPVVDAEFKSGLFHIKADEVRIEGLIIKNSGMSFVTEYAGIKIDSANNCVIRGNKILYNYFAIYIAYGSDCMIENNIISGRKSKSETTSGNGIHLWYCKNITIVNNKISNQRDGIYLEFSENSTIEDNISEDNLRYGLHFMFSHRCVYKGNTFRRNVGGVAVMYTKHVHMYNNKFENNWGPASYGLLLKDITDSEIKNNLFHENSSAIYLENSARLKIDDNNFIDNGWAVKIKSNSMDNEFTKNNFVDNTFDVATGSIKNHVIFNKNFWSKYTGYDLNHDGIGDVPYKPVGLFSAIIENNSPAMMLLRSLFIQILEVAEKVVPTITPVDLEDAQPLIKSVR